MARRRTTVDDRWEARPIEAGCLRALTFLLPVVLCGAIATVLVEALPPATEPATMVLVIAFVLGVTTTLLLALELVMRRFLPLVFLLRLSLAFPGRAPSRYAVARKAGGVREYEAFVAEQGHTEAGEAAERLLVLVAALSRHDRATRGHAERVRVFAEMLSEELDLPSEDRDHLRWVALLHDIGKLHVPSRILNKAGRPDEREWQHLHAHPTLGSHLASPLSEHLGPWFTTIEQHHERWDGTGYPAGLAGDRISRGARIVAVADAYEVMTAARSYHQPRSALAARQELVACSGSQFDPAIVRAFLRISLPRLRWVVGPLAVAAQVPALSRVGSRMGAMARETTQAAAASVGAVAVALGGGAAVLGQLQALPAGALEPDMSSTDDGAAQQEPSESNADVAPAGVREDTQVLSRGASRNLPAAPTDDATVDEQPQPTHESSVEAAEAPVESESVPPAQAAVTSESAPPAQSAPAESRAPVVEQGSLLKPRPAVDDDRPSGEVEHVVTLPGSDGGISTVDGVGAPVVADQAKASGDAADDADPPKSDDPDDSDDSDEDDTDEDDTDEDDTDDGKKKDRRR